MGRLSEIMALLHRPDDSYMQGTQSNGNDYGAGESLASVIGGDVSLDDALFSLLGSTEKSAWEIFASDLEAFESGDTTTASAPPPVARSRSPAFNPYAKPRRDSFSAQWRSYPPPQPLSFPSQGQSRPGAQESYFEREEYEEEEEEPEPEEEEVEEEEWTERTERRGRGKRTASRKRRSEPNGVTKAESNKRIKVKTAKGKASLAAAGAAGMENAGSRKPTLLWRKYGQKNLRGKPWKGIVRCYYKCHDPNCPARKLVEKHASNLDKVIDVRYEAEHNHPVAEGDREESGLFSIKRGKGDDGDASDDTMEI